MKRGALCATIIVLLAYVVRIHGLAVQSFWWDEAYSAVVARGSIGQIIEEISARDFHPPMHYLLIYFWSRIAGEGEFALRLISVAAGTLTVALGYATGRRLFGMAGGLVSSILVASSPFLIYYSTEARMFALAAMFALLTTYLGHRAIEKSEGRIWIALAVTLTLSWYNYYYSVFAIVPIGLYALFRSVRHPRSFLLFLGTGLAAALLYLPWVPILLGRVQNWSSPWTAPTTPGKVIRWTWPTFFTGIPALEQWDDVRLRILLLAVPAIGAILFLLLWKVPARYRWSLIYALVVGLVPIALMAVVSIVRPIYHPRYAIPAMPGIVLGIAGLVAMPIRWAALVRVALACAVAMLFGFGLWRYQLGDGLTRDNYREAIGYVNQNQEPGDTAINNIPPGFAYYYKGTMPNREFPVEPYDPARIVKELGGITEGRQRIWYVTHLLRPSDPEGFVHGQLIHHAKPVETRDFGPITVALFELTATTAFSLPTIHPIPDIAVGDDLTLIGMGIDASPALSGKSAQVMLVWRVIRQPSSEFGVWMRLKDERGFSWGREDHRPRNAAYLPTYGWVVGSEVITRHEVPILSGTPPGTYALETGVYQIDNLRGLEFKTGTGEKIGPALSWGNVSVVSNPAPQLDRTLTGPIGTIDSSVQLAGSGLGQKEAAAGNTVDFTALWKVTGPVRERELIWRLLGPNGGITREQRLPTLNGKYPVQNWVIGELLRDQGQLSIPATAEAGQYRVEIGLFRPGQSSPLIEIGTLNVTAIPRSFEVREMQNRREIDFGDGMRLIGWNLAPSPGKMRLTLFWQPNATPSKEYRVFNHVLANDEKILAQKDGVPANWTRVTTGWVAGEIVEDAYEIEYPPETAPRRVRFGVYEPISGLRLKLPDGKDHVDLTEITP